MANLTRSRRCWNQSARSGYNSSENVLFSHQPMIITFSLLNHPLTPWWDICWKHIKHFICILQELRYGHGLCEAVQDFNGGPLHVGLLQLDWSLPWHHPARNIHQILLQRTSPVLRFLAKGRERFTSHLTLCYWSYLLDQGKNYRVWYFQRILTCLKQSFRFIVHHKSEKLHQAGLM